MTKSWMTLTIRNTEPQRTLRTAAPEEEAEQSPECGGRVSSSRKGDQLIQVPQGPPPLLKPRVLICLLSPAALVLGHLPTRSTASGLNSVWECPCPRTYSPEDGNISDVLFASVFLPRMSLCSLFLTEEFR